MKRSSLLLLCFGLLTVKKVSTQFCDPNDEFEDDNNITESEWNDLMDKLDELTFNTLYTKQCKSDTDQSVTIGVDSDILWDLRFTLYSERQNNNEKTIEECYKLALDQEGLCDASLFKNCMKEARRAMLEDLTSSWWRDKINEKLAKMAEAC